MNEKRTYFFRALKFFVILILLRTLLRGGIWAYFGVYDSVEIGVFPNFVFSLFFNIYETPAFILFFTFFLFGHFLVRHFFQASLTQQIVMAIALTYPVAILCFWSTSDWTYFMTINEMSWQEIFKDQLREGFQFYTFLSLAILFAFLHYEHIVQRRWLA